MASIPLPALGVQPQQDTLGSLGKILAIKGALQNQQQQQALMPGQLQAQQQALQEGALNLKQRQAMNDAWTNAIKVDPQSGESTFDTGLITSRLAQSGAGEAIPGVLQHIQTLQKTGQDIKESQAKVAASTQDYLGDMGAAIQKSNYDPGVASALLRQAAEIPAFSKQAQALQQQISQNPASLKPLVDQVVQASPKQRELAASEQTAAARQTTAQTEAQKFAAESDPNSPFNQAKVQVAGQSAQAEAKAKYPYESNLVAVRQQVENSFWNNKDAQSQIENKYLQPYQQKMQAVNELNSAVDQAQQGNVAAARGVLLKLIGVSNPDGPSGTTQPKRINSRLWAASHSVFKAQFRTFDRRSVDARDGEGHQELRRRPSTSRTDCTKVWYRLGKHPARYEDRTRAKGQRIDARSYICATRPTRLRPRQARGLYD